MLNYFKFHSKNLFLVVIVTGFVGIIYLIYFFFIGIPKTQARNYYLLAERQIQEGQYEDAKSSLRTALSFWKEGYIEKKFEEIN